MVLPEELENVHFLQHFKRAYVLQMASLARLVECQPEDFVFREGQSDLHVYLLLQGNVALDIRVPDLGVIEVHRVEQGELLGWSPVLGQGRMTATARALTRCRLAALDADQIRALAEHDPKFGLEFFRHLAGALAERLRSTRQQLPDVGRHHMLAVQEGAD